MAKDFWVFCLFAYFVRADTDYELYNNDGWIPITNVQAYNTRRSDVEGGYIKENNEYHNLNDFIQVVTPEVRNGKDFSHLEIIPIKHSKSRDEFEVIKQARSSIDPRDRGSTVCSERNTNVTPKINPVVQSDASRFDRSLRMLYKQTTDNKAVVTEKTLNTHEQNGNTNVNLEENKTLERKNYEVTEEAESDIKHGYVYETPKPNTSNKLNLTDKLFNILAKYNIRADDDLPNYDLSLKDKVRNPSTSEMVRPFDFKARGYNSPDHLPVDPLLAVFLSHYGHYLPTAYGIRNNYNNGYGYLASNNIHNNKPFGMYKMFSDTDAPN
ncbi:hypothetical protein O3G_MSEX009617 [Manduca sexta]|uniref:Seminal fluid protein n=1 Tax=Manduca sexta TaxID=7130 RepID=A0A921ZF08_MANSE|nr:hypothetical protein O3G_MSEX009617 [Manduca sexta]